MALHRRRILWPDCEEDDNWNCKLSPPVLPPVLAPAPPVISPAPPPPFSAGSQSTYGFPQRFRKPLVVCVSLFAFVTILLTYYVAFRWYRRRRRRRRRGAGTPGAVLPPPPPRPESDGDLRQDLLAGAGEGEPYHVWYIRTTGLDEPTIGAISVCAYRRGEGLVEGTDCSICLGEFREGAMLRLLPKCSHAFHIPCIDTWLRSRVNCPLCRAPILAPPAIPPAAATAGELDSSSSRAATFTADVRSPAVVGDDDDDDDDEEPGGSAAPEDTVPARFAPRGSSSSSEVESEIWVTIDLGCGETERERAESEVPAAEDGGAPGVKMKLEPLRRSVSMDFIAPGWASNSGGDGRRGPTASGEQASAAKSGRKEGPTEMGRSTSTNSFGVSFLSRLSGRARGPNLPS